MHKKNIIGIDPGGKGAIVVWTHLDTMEIHKMPETPQDVYDLLKVYEANSVCYLEKVGGMPGMGGSAMFNFGRGFGHIEMALLALRIPTEIVTPQKWQKELQMGNKGDRTKTEWKNHLKERAQQLFPDKKFTLDTADAALICEYGKRKEKVN
jgi:hypothetical protein